MSRSINLKHWRERCIAAKNYCQNYYKKNPKTVHRVLAAVAALLLLCIIGTLYSKVNESSSPRLFDRYLGRAPYAVVMFYEKDREALRDNKKLSHTVQVLSDMFDGVSDRSRYKDAGLVFLKVNVSREKLLEVAQSYDVTKFPTFMLFNFGKPVSDAMLSGNIASKALESFIESYLKDHLDTIIENKEIIHERRLQDVRYNTPYWYWGYGSPYYTNWNGRYAGWGYGWSN
jgi:hypothetical protein